MPRLFIAKIILLTMLSGNPVFSATFLQPAHPDNNRPSPATTDRILIAGDITDRDEEANMGDPDEEANMGDPEEKANAGDPDEEANAGDPDEEANTGDPDEEANMGDSSEKDSF